MSIPCYLLDNDSISIEHTNLFDINLNFFDSNKSRYNNLKQAIIHAVTADQDVICCVLDDFSCKLSFEEFETLIVDLVEQEVFSYYIGADSFGKINFSKYCAVQFEDDKVPAFILTQPMYEYVLSLLDYEDFSEMSWTSFLRLIIPHSILILEEKNLEVQEELKIHVISPFYNAGKYVNECWKSIQCQTYSNYHVYFSDDNSDDHGIDTIPNELNITKIVNKNRLYALENTLNVLRKFEIGDNDIIVILDGDDILPHKYVFNILNTIYQSTDVLFTYGTIGFLNDFKFWKMRYTEEEFENIRKVKWKIAPLRTFKYILFQELLKQDPELTFALDNNKLMLTMPADMALFFPLIEIAGFDRTKFIPTPMYKYRLHEQNDHRINRSIQYKGEMIIRSKQSLNRL